MFIDENYCEVGCGRDFCLVRNLYLMSCYSRILTLSHYNTPTREVYIFRSWGHLVLVRREERNRLHSREWVPPDISRLINLIVIQAGPEGDVQIAFWHYPGFSIFSSACAFNLGLFKTKSFLCRDTQICITKRNIFGLGVCNYNVSANV